MTWSVRLFLNSWHAALYCSPGFIFSVGWLVRYEVQKVSQYSVRDMGRILDGVSEQVLISYLTLGLGMESRVREGSIVCRY